jgi:hypothetical protein
MLPHPQGVVCEHVTIYCVKVCSLLRTLTVVEIEISIPALYRTLTTDVNEMLSRSQPPSVDDVEYLLDEAENPFEVDERLEELASEL